MLKVRILRASEGRNQSVLVMCLLAFLFVLTNVAGAAEAMPKQRTYGSPQEAFRALAEACKANDEALLLEILGQELRGLIIEEDKAHAREVREQFYNLYNEYSNVEMEGDAQAILHVGKLDWPFPVPVVKEGSVWRFDAEKGKDEILNRRIGEDELVAIGVCRSYVEAQQAYSSEDRDGDQVLEYAIRLVSTPGKKDGLFWEARKGDELSPFGPLSAEERKDAEGKQRGAPFYGYYFKVLTRQGEKAPGGKYDYIINGNMIAGFALLAFPAEYGTSGIMTFVVNHMGKVYQKDLGEHTAEIAGEMEEYNPDETWTLVEEEGE